jgi:hypothetical protein
MKDLGAGAGSGGAAGGGPALLDLAQTPLDLRLEPARCVVLDRAKEAFGRIDRKRLRPVPGAHRLVVPQAMSKSRPP